MQNNQKCNIMNPDQELINLPVEYQGDRRYTLI